MNIYTHYFLWGYGLGLLTGGAMFFFLGRIFEQRSYLRSEYKKMKDDFNKQMERVSKRMDERANKSL